MPQVGGSASPVQGVLGGIELFQQPPGSIPTNPFFPCRGPKALTLRPQQQPGCGDGAHTTPPQSGPPTSAGLPTPYCVSWTLFVWLG